MAGDFHIRYNALPTLRKFHKSDARVRAVLGPVGCLPAETEVMTPRGWVRIDEWSGQEILQWDSKRGECRFIKPRRYIVGDCECMVRLDCGRHMAMTMTPDHRIPLLDWKGNFVVKQASLVMAHPSRHTLVTTWSGSGEVGLTDDELRLWVATAADGHYPPRGNKCVFTFRKRRKVERLTELLRRMGLKYAVTTYHRGDDGADEVSVTIPRRDLPKHLDWRLSRCSGHQAMVVLDEMQYWDGLYGQAYDRFNSTNKQDCDIIQYLAHCCGRNATMSKYADTRNRDWADGWCVHPAKLNSRKNCVQVRCDSLASEVYDTTDGKQYCFETDTGFFVVRQEGHIFVTGNSGKSSAMILGEPLLRGMRQSPGPDMVRRTRGVMIRNTYNELITTTMKTFREWWGTAICTYKSDKPLSAVVRFPMKDETLVEIEVLFLALDKPDDVGKVRSLELTWGYINEASEISDFAIMDALNERIGRYPKQWDDGHGGYTGGCDWSGIWLDSNAPDDEHWIFKKFEVEKPEGYEIFHQPPAVLLKEGSTPENPVWVPNKGQVPGIPPAENIEHLGKAGEGWKYYMNQIPGKDYERVRVMLQGEYGTVAYGRPVFPEYKDAVFYAPNHKDADGKPKDVTVMRGLPLLLGIDFGIRFCGYCFAQLSPMRQLRIIEDGLLTDVSTRDAANFLMAKLHNEYRGLKVMARGDPAGMQRSRTDGRYDIDIMNEMGIPTQPCVTNSIKERIEALKLFMRKLVDGEPGLIIGSKAQYIRKGMLGRYYFKKISTAGREAMYKAEPMKNEFSHPMDSAQYIAASLVMESELRSEAVQTYGSEFVAVSQPRVATAIDSAGIY